MENTAKTDRSEYRHSRMKNKNTKLSEQFQNLNKKNRREATSILLRNMYMIADSSSVVQVLQLKLVGLNYSFNGGPNIHLHKMMGFYKCFPRASKIETLTY